MCKNDCFGILIKNKMPTIKDIFFRLLISDSIKTLDTKIIKNMFISNIRRKISSEILKTYHQKSLAAASNFSDYNFREYFVRKVNHDFGQADYSPSLEELEENLKMLEQQSAISQMYKAEKTVVEEPWKDRINN